MEMTERVASFIVDSRYEALPEEVVTAARRAILDTLGVTLAGAAEAGSRILLDSIEALGEAGTASVFGTGLRSSVPQAALANGTLGHALDFDDVNVSMRGHPSIPVLPAVLALAEQAGSPGREALTAFITGFEVECKLGRAVGPSSYAQGWHATSVLGSIGAAAAAARLLRLDADQTRHALGIASSMASGTRQNFGTMTKPLHAGIAARAGVEAARLASRGFTADPDILQAPLGFGPLFSPDGDWRPERLGDLGEPWDIITPGISVKKYPCFYMTHRAVDAALAATGGRLCSPAEVESIQIRAPAGSVSALIHHRPTTGLEAKFSMEYCVAAALLDGGLSLGSFDAEAVQRSTAQELLRRVEVVELAGTEMWVAPQTQLTVRLRDGSSLEAEVTREHGDPTDPLSWEELVEKYRDCASRVLPGDQVVRSLELIENLNEIDIVELARALSLQGASSRH